MLVHCGAAVQQDICDATGLPGALGMIQSRFGAHSYGADLGLYKNLQESSSADSRHKLHPAPNSLIYSTTTSGIPESQECSVHTADQSSPVQSSPYIYSISKSCTIPGPSFQGSIDQIITVSKPSWLRLFHRFFQALKVTQLSTLCHTPFLTEPCQSSHDIHLATIWAHLSCHCCPPITINENATSLESTASSDCKPLRTKPETRGGVNTVWAMLWWMYEVWEYAECVYEEKREQRYCSGLNLKASLNRSIYDSDMKKREKVDSVLDSIMMASLNRSIHDFWHRILDSMLQPYTKHL